MSQRFVGDIMFWGCLHNSRYIPPLRKIELFGYNLDPKCAWGLGPRVLRRRAPEFGALGFGTVFGLQGMEPRVYGLSELSSF